LQNRKNFHSLHPLFVQAFEYLQSQDLQALESGKYEISGEELKAIVSDKPGKTVAESVAKFECHDKFIDIQLCVRGKETLGWKPRESCVAKKEEYNPEKDVTFYTDAPDMFFQLTDNQFAIFFPNDVHAPMIGTDNIKKVVIKVKI